MTWVLKRTATISLSVLFNMLIFLSLYYLSNNEHIFSFSREKLLQKKAPEKSHTDLQLIQTIAQNNKAQTNNTSFPEKKIAHESKIIKTHIQQQAEKKLPITLAQLNAGFLHHIKENNNDNKAMPAKRNVTQINDQELRQLRYKEKLDKCLQNSFNTHKKLLEVIDTENCAPVSISMSLKRNGMLGQIAIANSSGNMSLDRFVLSVFQDASSSFPPVPQHIPHDPYIIGYTIAIDSFKEKPVSRK